MSERLLAGKPKRHYREQFKDSSDRLFNSAWSTYLKYLNGAIDSPRTEQDVIAWLTCIIGEKVNDSSSSFHIYG
jgi:hypothetical protein